MLQTPAATPDPATPPSLSVGAVFLRFLRFGLLAWGGPTAQIAMIRDELVDRDGWISRERFNRVLAVYQALPGPEAHELCVYFGMVARGRVGAIAAGLGFMLPGLLLMLLWSWAYVEAAALSPGAGGTSRLLSMFAACQPAVVALIVRGVVRIGRHALVGPHMAWLWLAALGGAMGQWFHIPFWIALVGGGLIAALGALKRQTLVVCVAALWFAVAALWFHTDARDRAAEAAAASAKPQSTRMPHFFTTHEPPSAATLLQTGLSSGLLTFGGAYTAIPFVHDRAVGDSLDDRNPRGWMTDDQFLDGLTIGSIIPAPLIIFGTFVGYIGGGIAGALLFTAGIFLPAFLFTLIGHRFFELLVDEPRIHALLDGVTAAVVGIMAVTTVSIGLQALNLPSKAAIFSGAFVVLLLWSSRWATPAVVLGAATLGLLLPAWWF